MLIPIGTDIWKRDAKVLVGVHLTKAYILKIGNRTEGAQVNHLIPTRHLQRIIERLCDHECVPKVDSGLIMEIITFSSIKFEP